MPLCKKDKVEQTLLADKFLVKAKDVETGVRKVGRVISRKMAIAIGT